ncbi:MAG: DUF58 domain-containing protein [Gloeomargaritaceae cyanobacterium C42_A2020_066]|nr:DUF58 domain-containing protein [Gloeomargaritaceae cyanobacterium C42_A2020_066]
MTAGLRQRLADLEQRLPRRFGLTRVGRTFTIVTFLVCIGSFNTGNNLLYLLLGMLLSLIIASAVLSEQVVKGLTAERQLPTQVFAGQPALVVIQVTNTKRRVPSFSLTVQDRVTELGELPSLYFLRIDPGETVQGIYRVTFPQRGQWLFTGYELRTSFPFELFRKLVRRSRPAGLLVYPNPLEPPAMVLATLGERGSRRRPAQGQGSDFFGLRDFRPGDDVRAIHWKTSARRDQWLVREMERQDAESVTLCLDHRWQPQGRRAAVHRADLERAISLCAGLAQRLIGWGYSVTLVTLDQRTTAGQDTLHLDTLLRVLAMLTFPGDPEQQETAGTAGRWRVTPRDQCILVGPQSPFPSTQGAPILARLVAAQGELSVTP